MATRERSSTPSRPHGLSRDELNDLADYFFIPGLKRPDDDHATAAEITDYLGPAAVAEQADWLERAAHDARIAAGLHVCQEATALVLRTGPAGRRVGHIGRDYWHGDVHSQPYEAVLAEGEASGQRRTRTLPALPLDPLAAAGERDRVRPNAR